MSVGLQADTSENWITFAEVFKKGKYVEIAYHKDNFESSPICRELLMAKEWANFLAIAENSDGACQIDVKIEEIPGNGPAITEMWLRRLIVD